MKYVLFVCPLKCSPSLLETQCLYNFSQLFGRNSPPGRLPLLCQSHSPSSPARKACTACGPHSGMSGRAPGASGHSPSSENTSCTQKVLTHNSSKWLCSSVSHHHTQSGFFLPSGSAAAAFFIPSPLSKLLFIRQYLLKGFFFLCHIKHGCSAGTCTE